MGNQFDDIGFAAGVIRGARTFLVDVEGWLTGLYYRQRWTNLENEAICRKHERPPMTMYLNGQPYLTPPEAATPLGPHSIGDCKHGFYGYHDGSNDYRAQGPVYGVIEGYGVTVFGTKGFRCMKARIVALTMTDRVTESQLEQLSFNYWNVPFFDDFGSMVEAFPPDKGEAA